MKASTKFTIVFALTVFVIAGCGEGGGGGTVLPSASKLRVKVNSYNDWGRVAVLPGATVVLGDNTGSMVDSAVTDANGEATFSNPPKMSTITSAVTGTGFYSLHTFYDVNVPAITVNVYKKTTREKIGEVNLKVTCNGAWGAEMHASGWSAWELCSGGTATASVDVYADAEQADGKFSFLVVGTDSSGNPISTGSLLDQEFTNGMTVDITLSPQDPFPQQVAFTNIPPNNGGAGWTNLNMRRTGGQLIFGRGAQTPGFPSLEILSSSLTHSFFVPSPTGFGTSFDLYGRFYLDTDGTGTTDTNFGFRQLTTTPANCALDLDSFPTTPSGIDVTNAATDRPAISFNAANMTLITMSPVVSGPSTTFYSYILEASGTRTSLVFPELPDSLASFRPGPWAGKFDLNVENHQRGYCSSYSDCLTKNDALDGAWELTYLGKWTGQVYLVDGSSVTLHKVGHDKQSSGSLLPAQSLPAVLQHRVWLMR